MMVFTTIRQQKLLPEILPGGEKGWQLGLTTLPHSCADCLKTLEATSSWNTSDQSRVLQMHTLTTTGLHGQSDSTVPNAQPVARHQHVARETVLIFASHGDI
jgi:hypothetical protein